MKKNLYFRHTYRRENILFNLVLGLFRMIASYPRLLLEVFLRKNFGQRYFRLSSVITVIFIFGVYPVLSSQAARFFRKFRFAAGEQDSFMAQYFLWYVFLIAFAYMGWTHYKSNKKEAGVFNFDHFSLSSGEINPRFLQVKIPNIKTTIRLVECFLEPAVFLFAGIVLWLIGQKLGVLLTFSSIVYAFSYIDAYRQGDNFVLDKTDEMICNAQLEKAFVGEENSKDGNKSDSDADAKDDIHNGFRFRGRKPESQERRKQILPFFTEDEKTTTVH